MDKEVSFTATSASINFDLLRQYCIQPRTPKYDIKYKKVVQARKHKKKRINKKWLKRYGHRIITVTSKGWELTTNADGYLEFVRGENMTKTFCDCCKREIRSVEKRFSMIINSNCCKEMHVQDMCIDCYDQIKKVVTNAESWRKNSI